MEITRTGKQYRVTIPNDLIKILKWDENTEILFVPFVQDAKSELDEKTPILLKSFKNMK